MYFIGQLTMYVLRQQVIVSTPGKFKRKLRYIFDRMIFGRIGEQLVETLREHLAIWIEFLEGERETKFETRGRSRVYNTSGF